jgi:hypothetical protein
MVTPASGRDLQKKIKACLFEVVCWDGGATLFIDFPTIFAINLEKILKV